MLSVFSINNDTGALTEADRPTVLEDAAGFAVSIVLSPSGDLAYVFTIGVPDEHTVTESMQVFHLDKQTGATATLSTLTWEKPASISFRAIPTGTLAILPANQPDDGATPSTAIRPNFVFLTDFAGPGVSVFSNRLDANSLAAITPSALPAKQ